MGGAPRKTDERTDRHIIQIVQKYPFKSSKTISNELNLNIDSSTVRRRALEAGFRSYRPAKKHCSLRNLWQKCRTYLFQFYFAEMLRISIFVGIILHENIKTGYS